MTKHLQEAADRAHELADQLGELGNTGIVADATTHLAYMAGLIHGALALDSTPKETPAPKPSSEMGPITDRHTSAVIGFSASTAPGINRKRPVVR